MFHDAYQKLELADKGKILSEINPKLDGVEFDQAEATVMAVDVPFYKGYQLLDIADHRTMPALRRFVVYKPGDATVLNYTNEPIYALNKAIPVKLSKKNIDEYVRFFFSYVKGKHGWFRIAENVDDIIWKEEPPPAARKALGKMIIPITLLEKAKNGTFYLEATMMFKDSLFKADIDVAKNGTIEIRNEELLIEDIPVLDDIFVS